MAQFRGILKGTRGEVSRLGDKRNGLISHVDGWNSGVKVSASYNSTKNRDEFDVYATSGSSGRGSSKWFARVFVEKGELVVETA